ncbi:hypothetical protein [Xanthobacter sp. 126]|uniref:hypothetical protein n=1 Tax=Xanthobacter sp. 126 TaxID=1131814 RepID=UPI000685DED5|nr:hypothetical protein [Xanthobacter sp. 126]
MLSPEPEIELIPGETWTAAMLRELRRGCRDGEPVTVLAARLRSSVRAISRRIERYGFEPLEDGRVKSRRLTEHEIGQFRQLRDSGVPKGVIADRLGVTQVQLNRAIRYFALGRPKVRLFRGHKVCWPGRELTEAEKREAAALYADGVATWYIAERYGRGPKFILQLMKRMNVARPPGWHDALIRRGGHIWSERERNRLSLLVEQGLGICSISEDLCLPTKTVAKELKRIGLKPRNRRGFNASKARAEARDHRVYALHIEGLDNSVIAARLGVGGKAVAASLERSRGKGLNVRQSDRAARWSPTDREIDLIAVGYKLGASAATIASHCTAERPGQVKDVAHAENIRHPLWRRPHLQAIRPETLLYHRISGTLDQHLDNCLLVYYRTLTWQIIEAAVSRAAEALAYFPHMRPVPFPVIDARASQLRASLARHLAEGRVPQALAR